MIPMNIPEFRLAKETKLNPTRISEIIHGENGIFADTVIRLSKFFGNTVHFWMGIQDEFEVREEEDKIKDDLKDIRNYKESISV